MIPRKLEASVAPSLESFPAVALLGPRQVGKTTLALELSRSFPKEVLYLDLERDSDQHKLADAELYLKGQAGRLVVLDEVQRRPDLFPLMRSLIDERIRAGERTGQFLVLGSASRDLLRQSSESLAGRIAYHELRPFTLAELPDMDVDTLWGRGGFPGSLLAEGEATSWSWRTQFISTYLERDLPQLGPKLPSERMRRLWTMLAFGQGDLLHLSKLAANLDVSGTTVNSPSKHHATPSRALAADLRVAQTCRIHRYAVSCAP